MKWSRDRLLRSRKLNNFTAFFMPLCFIATFAFFYYGKYNNFQSTIIYKNGESNLYLNLIECYDLQYKLWEWMVEENMTKEEITNVLNQLYPYDLMKQKVFFFDLDRNKPYHKTEKQGIYSTEEVQKIIYENQYPEDCSKRNFLILPNLDENGIGSCVHVIGAFIASGIMQNRTVVYNPKDHYRYSSFSQCNGTLGFDCFFRPLSSCQLTPEEIDYSNPKYKKAPHRPRAKRAVPESVVRIFSKTSAHPDSYYFLWRIQATFFMVQFNDKLKKWINEFKPKYIVNPKDRYDASVFIRRGHKYLEMKLVSSDKYRYPLEILRKLKSDGNNKKLSVFVNSDDPEALNEFLKFSDIYDISYYNCTRPKGGHDHFIVTDNKIALWESVSSFANLVELINVDHIIGTIGSNWGRLILELNLQKYPNGSRFPYFEVGENPCITPSQCRMCNRKISFSW